MLMRILFAVMGLVFSLSCWGELNSPIQTPAKAASHQQTEGKNPQSKGAPEKPVAQNNIVVPQSVVASNHQAESAKSTENKDGHSAAEWWTAAGTVALAVITGFLFWATYRLYTTTVSLARDSNETAKLAKQAYENLERPYVFAFDAYKFDFFMTEHNEGVVDVDYKVANYGKIPAVIEHVLVGISKTNSGRPENGLQMEGDKGLMRSPILSLGEVHADLYERVPQGIKFDVRPPNEILFALENDEDIFFWIQLFYRGPFTEGHETSACWRLDIGTNRLVPFGGEEYNYTK